MRNENVQSDMKNGEHWSANEVERIVADYFDMLALELRGRVAEKARRNEALRQHLENRSKGSVEFKHANISAVMASLGLPFIDGYKPRGNYQGLLAETVVAYLNAHPLFFVEAASHSVDLSRPAVEALLERIDGASDIFEPGPVPIEVPHDAVLRRRLNLVSVDFAQRDQANAPLAQVGIFLAIALERRRLTRDHGRFDLAEKVRGVSADESEGFHVLSFDGNHAGERHIGVKTTALGKHAPFCATPTEVAHSERVDDRYFLYRFFHATHRPRAYARQGPLSAAFRLEPTGYVCAL